MRVKLKTLKNVVVDLDLPTDTSVQKIKEAGAASAHGTSEGWDPEGMKLIYQGKIMDNAKDMASYNVTEDDFMVVMAAKAKKPATSEAAPAAAAAAAIAATSPSPEPAASPAPATTPAAPAPTPAPAPAPAPAAEQQLLPEHEASVSNLCDMGFPRDAVMAAMRAAYMNADRAVEYLTNGIPEQLQGGGGAAAGDDEDMDDAPETPATWELLAASPAFRAEIAGVRDQAQLQQYLADLKDSDPLKLELIQGNAQAFAAILNEASSSPAAAPAAAAPPFGGGGGGGGGGLPAGLPAALAQNPAMLEGLLQNPDLLRQLMQSPEVQEMLQSPEAMAQLGINPEMLQAMMGGLAGGGGGGGMMQVEVTPEDEEAISRLMALGFPRGAAIQAYMACDKDENLAANFLFDQGNDLE